MTSWTIYALVIETPGSELGIFWILVIQIVPCSISMWHDCETQPHKCMTRGPSHFNLAWKSIPFVLVVSMLPGRGREVGSIPTRSKLVFHAMNQRQRELLYGVRSTDWAENPQVACDWSGATSDARITTSYQCVNSTIGLINYCWQKI